MASPSFYSKIHLVESLPGWITDLTVVHQYIQADTTVFVVKQGTAGYVHYAQLSGGDWIYFTSPIPI